MWTSDAPELLVISIGPFQENICEARYSGGAVAVTTFATILTTTQISHATTGVIAAVEAAGASPSTARAVLAALPMGAAALEKVPGLTTAIATAAGGAFLQSYVAAIKQAHHLFVMSISY